MGPSTELLLNAAYLVFLGSLVVRDVLWLRVIMSSASVLAISYAFLIDNPSMLAWNAIFLSINVYHIVRIMIDRRPISLSADLEEIYRSCFANMSQRDFLNFWNFGQELDLEGGKVCTEGEQPSKLFYVTAGEAEVTQAGKPIATRQRLNFIAELSFFTGQPASADVTINGKVVAWTREKLDDLRKIKPDLIKALRESIGRGVCQKLVGKV